MYFSCFSGCVSPNICFILNNSSLCYNSNAAIIPFKNSKTDFVKSSKIYSEEYLVKVVDYKVDNYTINFIVVFPWLVNSAYHNEREDSFCLSLC